MKITRELIFAAVLFILSLGVTADQTWTIDERESSRKHRIHEVTTIPDHKFEYDHESWYEHEPVTSSRELHEQRHYYK